MKQMRIEYMKWLFEQLEVKQQYEKLKGEGKLSKFMAKKRQRNAAKERKKMPDERRADGE